jgi:rifampicin phosphotransferase
VSVAIPLSAVRDKDRRMVGGKGFALAKMVLQGLPVPPGVCVTTEAYQRYVDETGLKVKIIRELNRKRFEDMRWEEMWDTALRIRNLFLRMPMPPGLASALGRKLSMLAGEGPVAVRSSAPGEDAATTSFAGLHESYLNVRGLDAVLEHIRLVWASLWSDAALLYRRELGLDVEGSAMAVVVQRIIPGDRSGVVFGMNPNDTTQSVVEAVHGLNEGLVSGQVEPDRWIIERESGRVLSHSAPVRDRYVVLAEEGVRVEPLPAELGASAPLEEPELSGVHGMAMRGEAIFGKPQDMEWTFQEKDIFLLQSRPITTVPEEKGDDQRPWYLSLRRSFDNLKDLRRRIEERLIPEMVREADLMAAVDLDGLDTDGLVREIIRRAEAYKRWKDVYWEEFIPMAHGMRLFGLVYNDAVRPDDPYEFMDLLGTGDMVSLERNRALEDLADRVRTDDALRESIGSGVLPAAFNERLHEFTATYGELFEAPRVAKQSSGTLVAFILEMAGRRRREERRIDAGTLRERFLAHFQGDKRIEAGELLELGRASYRLRDNDNVFLDRVKAQLLRALNIRAQKHPEGEEAAIPPDVVAVIGEVTAKAEPGAVSKEPGGFSVMARQIVGQPASAGLASGVARIVADQADALQFKTGEVLICDAIEPAITFVVPLAAAIVERRGGMLIHGSIIAREYGIPCVTGVPEATAMIKTGDYVTVDGFLGIVIIGQ